MSKVDGLLTDYAAFHRTKGNVACHFVGIPLIVFGILQLLLQVRLFSVGLFWVTGAEALIAVATVYYLTLDVRLALGMLFASLALDFLGRLSWNPWIGVTAFLVGWVFQGIGHAVYEKRSPAFLRNVVHLMVGPIFLVNEALHFRKVEAAHANG
jgi:uncharacterized membrane protein YGL010W